MKKLLLFFGIALFSLNFCFSKSYAQGIIVSDETVDSNSITQTAKQIAMVLKQAQQYATQLEQFQNMLQNTLAPAMYIWDDAQALMGQVENLDNIEAMYGSSFGSYQNYLDGFYNLNYAVDNLCLSTHICSAQTFQQEEKASALQTQLNKGETQVINQQESAMQNDAGTLQRLQVQAQSAVGHMQALQTENMIASQQANQLLQMRRLMLAKNAAEAAQREEETKERAKALAFSQHLFQTNGYTPMPAQYWQ